MECNRLRGGKIKYYLDNYTKKSNSQYYISCNKCMEKTKEYNKATAVYKKKLQEEIKTTVKCECGKSYICYNKTHYIQHSNTKYHLKYIQSL